MIIFILSCERGLIVDLMEEYVVFYNSVRERLLDDRANRCNQSIQCNKIQCNTIFNNGYLISIDNT